MIMFFKKITESWVGKFIVVAIAIALSGIASVGTFFEKNTDAIRVGNLVMKPENLVHAVEKNAYRMTLQYVPLKTALELGVLKKTITEEVASMLFDIVSEDIGLIASTNSVGNYIINNPNFQTETGAYDPSIMSLYLTRMQMSEAEFIFNLRKELSRKHLTDAINAVITVPEIERDAVFAYQNERRDFDVILLPSTAVNITEKPTEKDLKEYYEALEDTLYTPEYRQIKVLRLVPDKVMSSIAVSEEELKEAYEARQDVYTTPEKRLVDQILVKDAETAQALFKEVNTDNFLQIAMDKNAQKKEDVELGWIEKTGVVEEVGEAIFGAPVNTVIPPVQSQFGYHILIVRNIEQEKKVPFDEAKEELKNTIQSQRAYDILVEKARILDLALGEGKTLEEGAKLISVPVDDIVWIDVSGIKEDGKTLYKMPTELLQKVFVSNVGDVSPLYEFENGQIVAELVNVKESALKSFEDVKDVLTNEWTKDMQKKKIADFSKEVFKKAQSNADFASVAKQYGLEIEKLTDLRREDVQGIPAQAVADLFKANKNDVQLVSITNNDYVLVKVAEIKEADDSDIVIKNLFSDSVTTAFTDSIYSEILEYYAGRNPVIINQELINAIFEPYTKN